ncbi:hypothetical protein [Marinifilum caeruleilacunae]|uniref:Uncharacterized protein n=1 Tax=Marinifilum caeruleilacunae TaxID=2499076 RepID=A0ABX1X0C9_9BACT|nr:hypothetical protein [Marinifilum caeruleilacunae]NOU61859.1 hypothetical protein [Marinifilum caeruleilacunae]
MKNRNTKDPGENHIYSFVLSNLFLFVGIFFSLNSASEVAILFYSLSVNLFFHWLGFYSRVKKKISHFSEYYNNLLIALYCIASAVPVFLLLIPLLLEISLSHWTLLLASLAISYLLKYLLKNYFSWETTTEKLMNRYRMSIEQERDENFQLIKAHLDLNPEKFEDYIEKSELFDDRIENYLKNSN